MATPSATTTRSSDDIDITAAPAVAGWTTPGGQTSYLYPSDSDPSHQITFDLHYRPAATTASFRLRAPIMLKGLGRQVTPLFLAIPPERVSSLSSNGPDQMPDGIRKHFGTSITALRFGLRESSHLIVPQINPLTPKKKLYWDMLDSLGMLARETSLTVYFATESLSEERLRVLCEAVSGGKLTTSVPHADIGRLYNGKGGRILEGSGAVPVVPSSIESPPSYNDIGPSAPPPPINQVLKDLGSGESSRKRRRRISDDSTASEASDSIDTGTALTVEAICRKLMNEMRREEREHVLGELKQMETRLMQWVDKRLSECKEELREEGNQASLQRETAVDEQIQEVRDDTDDLIDVRLDDRMDAVKIELEEYVADQVGDAEERLMDRLRTANVSIEFKIDE